MTSALPRLAAALLGTTLIAGPAAAVPAVATDIAPVQSLVARVMQGLGEPSVILPPGASPHDHALKPSESAALAGADVVFWVGPSLDVWMEKPLAALAGNATVVELLDSPRTQRLPARHNATFEAHEHGTGHDHADGDDDHADHDHGVEAPDAGAAAADHDHAADGHDHDGTDPHAWLDPQNAGAWLGTIAATLAQADPQNAAAYRRNAAEGQAELTALEAQMKAELKPSSERPFIVFHDAYQYFENRFGLEAAGSISLADGAAPGPQRLAEVQQKVRDLHIACAFREPQFDPALIRTVFEGMDVTIGVLDPLGAELTPGPDLYPQLLRQMAAAFNACAG